MFPVFLNLAITRLIWRGRRDCRYDGSAVPKLVALGVMAIKDPFTTLEMGGPGNW